MANEFDAISDKLIEVLVTADEGRRRELAQMVEDYCEKYPRTWATIKNGPAALALLFDAIVEGTDARPGYTP